MAKKSYRPEEIVTKLRQVEVLQSQGVQPPLFGPVSKLV